MGGGKLKFSDVTIHRQLNEPIVSKSAFVLGEPDDVCEARILLTPLLRVL
jgi:hypothetical protein